MVLPTTTNAWEYSSKVSGRPTMTGNNPTFTLKEVNLPPLGPNQILVRALYFSNDPDQRLWMGSAVPEDKFHLSVVPGQIMPAEGLAVVIATTSMTLKRGDLVVAWLGWQLYAVIDESPDVRAVNRIPGLDVVHHLGALGNTGLTAYYGLLHIGEAKKEDKIVISGAGGATGSMAVQIAKQLVGAENIIGIAGRDDKCRWVESLGAEKCLNYNYLTFETDLMEATKHGVDVYFDNVGGEILNLVLGRMSLNGRIAACGATAGHNAGGAFNNNLANWTAVILMRLQIEGFMQSVRDQVLVTLKEGHVGGSFRSNYASLEPSTAHPFTPFTLFRDLVLTQSDFPDEEAEKARSILQKAILEGRINVRGSQTVVECNFKDTPRVWARLFDEKNMGKYVTKLD